jgi:hypothetical protein
LCNIHWRKVDLGVVDIFEFPGETEQVLRTGRVAIFGKNVAAVFGNAKQWDRFRHTDNQYCWS